MIRNLKTLITAAMMLAAFAAIGALSAQAAAFHCSVEPCKFTARSDGTGKTAHQVFELKNSAGETSAITCAGVTGEGKSATKELTELTLSNIQYGEPCKFAGSEAAFVKMNECVYKFKANGEVAVSCPAGKVIEFGIPGCIGTVGAVAGLKEVTFHPIGEEAKTTTEVTAESHVPIPGAGVDGTKAGCGGFDPSKTPITGNYTTGNVIITGESDPGGIMANAWWA